VSIYSRHVEWERWR